MIEPSQQKRVRIEHSLGAKAGCSGAVTPRNMHPRPRDEILVFTRTAATRPLRYRKKCVDAALEKGIVQPEKWSAGTPMRLISYSHRAPTNIRQAQNAQTNRAHIGALLRCAARDGRQTAGLCFAQRDSPMPVQRGHSTREVGGVACPPSESANPIPGRKARRSAPGVEPTVIKIAGQSCQNNASKPFGRSAAARS